MRADRSGRDQKTAFRAEEKCRDVVSRRRKEEKSEGK